MLNEWGEGQLDAIYAEIERKKVAVEILWSEIMIGKVGVPFGSSFSAKLESHTHPKNQYKSSIKVELQGRLD